MDSIALATGPLPLWSELTPSVETAICAGAVAAPAAVIMGLLPGLKATGKGINVNLRELDGRTGTRLGPMWTALVVAQVAVAIAVLPPAFYLAWQVVQSEIAGPGFDADKFVVGTAALYDGPAAIDRGHLRRRQLELMSRLEAEPAVAAVTFSSHVPGLTAGRRLQFEGLTLPQGDGISAGTIHVAPGLFDAYGARIVAGRAFTAGDVGAAGAVIVNRTFEQTFLPNRSAIGQRFRFIGPPTQPQPGMTSPGSYEIVGVVDDFPSFPAALNIDDTSVIYHPAAPGDVHPIVLSIAFHDNVPAGFTDRVRAVGADVDPALQLRTVAPLSIFYRQLRSLWRYLAW